MDRREALKKMAATGVVVSGASAIASSTAFADGGTVNSRPGNTGGAIGFSASNTGDKKSKLITPTDATGPGNCSIGLVRKEYAWSVEGWRTSITGTQFSQTLQPATVTGQTPNFSATVRLTVRWTCAGNSGPAWLCRSFVSTVQATSPGQLGGVNITNLGEQSPGPNCPSP